MVWLADRRGVVTVFAMFLLVVLFGFVAFAVDTGAIVVAQTNLQNAADAASLAASQEVVRAIKDYTSGGTGGPQLTMDSYAAGRARAVAQEIAAANGAYLDPQVDVTFGRRMYNSSTNSWPISWNAVPFNVVRVTLKRTNPNLSAPDGRLPLSFGWALGKPSVPIHATASAFVESRDMVLVLDQSASMNDDSSLPAINALGQTAVNRYLDDMWDAIRAADPKWPGTNLSKFPAGGFGRITNKAGVADTWSYDNAIVQAVHDHVRATYGSADLNTCRSLVSLNLHSFYTVGGVMQPHFPFPQAGRDGNGVQNPRPWLGDSVNLWYAYCYYVKYQVPSAYRNRYGFRTLMSFLQDYRPAFHQSEDLWQTPHYPFHAVKNGATMFCDFLSDLNYGDRLGFVSYATDARVETSWTFDNNNVTLGSSPLTDQYHKIDFIQRHMQAGHYTSTTAIGDGLLKARQMLFGTNGNNGHLREGARPTIILMTDGLANVTPHGWSLPGSFKWADFTDFNGDGTPDYTTNDRHKAYAFFQAMEAYKQGAVVHTMAVGEYADRGLMRSIARATGGEFLDIPGGRDVYQMEEETLEAFRKIASMVPPSKLVHDSGSP